MTYRISDERLAELSMSNFPPYLETIEMRSCLSELQQSRALIAQLRTLAERMRGYKPETKTRHDFGVLATMHWMRELERILSSHGAAQAEKP